MSEWQPIETAPKDWVRVLVGWPKYHYHFGIKIGHYWIEAEGWVDDDDVLFSCAPTHWMLLPAPPETTDAP